MTEKLYEFEAAAPPVLTENMLRAEMERRKRSRETVLLALAVVLSQMAAVLLGVLAIGWVPWLVVLCFVYTAVTACGGGILAVLYTGRRNQTCQV